MADLDNAGKEPSREGPSLGGERETNAGSFGAGEGALAGARIGDTTTSPTGGAYSTASTGRVGQVTREAIARGSAPTQTEISAALQEDVNASLGYGGPGTTGPFATFPQLVRGAFAFLGGPLGLFGAAARGQFGAVTGVGELAGGHEPGGSKEEIGTQPGFPSGRLTSLPPTTGSPAGGSTGGGASYFGTGGAPGGLFVQGGVSPEQAADLTGLPLGGGAVSTRRRVSPWLWLLLLAAAAVAGYYVYRYYQKKKARSAAK